MSLPDLTPTDLPPPYPLAGAPAFAAGDAVRVRRGDAPGHIRAPWYIRGKAGRVERICGAFPNPEELAYGRPGTPPVTLYRVRFTMAELWGTEAQDSAPDSVDVEIYEHWLEVADATP